VSYVDISSHQADAGYIDLVAHWNAGHRDLCLKATEGTHYSWGQMRVLAQQWHGFGLDARVGYYHWLYGNLSADAQFSWFWSQVGGVFRRGDWLMTDFEDTDAARRVSDAANAAILRRFNELAAQKGPIYTYTGNWYLDGKPQCVAYLKTQPVVMSDYDHSPPLNPYGLTYVSHQFTETASVPGMPGLVDYNRWLGESTSGSGTPLTPAQTEDDLSAEAEAQIKDLHDRLAKFDQLFASVITIIQPGVADIRPRVIEIQADAQKVQYQVDTQVAPAVGRIESNAYGTYKAVQLVLDALAAVPPAPGSIDYSALAAAFRAELAKTPLTITGSAA
jgi:GH25 family lysozyme M1 (1,4-beta-N-acetylmuramidase)